MNKLARFIFLFILTFSTYHLVRDIIQTVGIHNSFTNILHRPHLWCGPYCNYVTFPLDILGILGSIIVLKRNNISLLGKFIVVALPLWLLAALLP